MTDGYLQTHAGHSIQNSTTMVSFSLFPSLPVELRVKIWRLIISAEQRVFRYQLKTCLFSLVQRISYNICSESRQEYLGFYGPDGTRVAGMDDKELGIDYARDVLLVPFGCGLSNSVLELAGKPIRFLAVDNITFPTSIDRGIDRTQLYELALWLGILPSVKELRLGRMYCGRGVGRDPKMLVPLGEGEVKKAAIIIQTRLQETLNWMVALRATDARGPWVMKAGLP